MYRYINMQLIVYITLPLITFAQLSSDGCCQLIDQIGHQDGPDTSAPILSVQSAQECCNHCQSNDKCVSWTYYFDECYMYDKPIENHTICKFCISGTPNSRKTKDCPSPILYPPCCQVVEYNIHQLGIDGADLGTVSNVVSARECCATCQSTSGCKGWTFDSQDCHLYSTPTDKSVSNPMYTSGNVIVEPDNDKCTFAACTTKLDLMLLIDKSGSMESVKPEEIHVYVSDIINSFFVNPGDYATRVSVTMFGRNVENVVSLQDLSSRNRISVIQKLNFDIPHLGWTDLEGGLKYILKHELPFARENVPKAIVILSDGHAVQNPGTNDIEHSRALRVARRIRKKYDDASIVAVAMGKPLRFHKLEKFASRHPLFPGNNGKMFFKMKEMKGYEVGQVMCAIREGNSINPSKKFPRHSQARKVDRNAKLQQFWQRKDPL